MQSIALHDTLTFESRSDSIIELKGNRKDLSYGEDNLIIKAAQLFRMATGVVKGVSITLNKQIPIAAGLGGGSSDAAVTLLALNSLWAVEWPIGNLVMLGSQIGSDVPFCIIGGTCVVEGTGEKVRPIPSVPKTSVLVIKPDFGVSTKKIYNEFDVMYNNHIKPEFSVKMEDAIIRGNDYKQYVSNDLEKVTKVLYPEVSDWIRKMKQSFETVIMSGSGPTILVFGEKGFINNAYNEIKNQTKFTHVTKYIIIL